VDFIRFVNILDALANLGHNPANLEAAVSVVLLFKCKLTLVCDPCVQGRIAQLHIDCVIQTVIEPSMAQHWDDVRANWVPA